MRVLILGPGTYKIDRMLSLPADVIVVSLGDVVFTTPRTFDDDIVKAGIGSDILQQDQSTEST